MHSVHIHFFRIPAVMSSEFTTMVLEARVQLKLLLHSSCFRLVFTCLLETVHFGVDYGEHNSHAGQGLSLIYQHKTSQKVHMY